jgi:CRP/FNR family transcriptional regulator
MLQRSATMRVALIFEVRMRQDVHTAGIPVLCVSCEARHKGVCSALKPAQLVELSRYASRQHLQRGQEMVGDTESVTTYSNILTGVAKLSKTMADGRQQIVGLQFAPDFLGRLYGKESAVTAEAASEVDLCRVPRAALEKLVADNPALERRLMQQTLRELDEARDWMVTLGRKTASEKVASFLYLIATHLDPASGSRRAFDLPLTRADIADFLGLTIETVVAAADAPGDARRHQGTKPPHRSAGYRASVSLFGRLITSEQFHPEKSSRAPLRDVCARFRRMRAA